MEPAPGEGRPGVPGRAGPLPADGDTGMEALAGALPSGEDTGVAGGGDPARLLPATGHAEVDEALSSLRDLATLPVEEHPAVFEQVHRRLAESLGETDGIGVRPGGPGAQPAGPGDHPAGPGR